MMFKQAVFGWMSTGLALLGAMPRRRVALPEPVPTTGLAAPAPPDASGRPAVGRMELEQARSRDTLVNAERLATIGSMASGIVHEMAQPVGAMMLQSSNAQASLATGNAGLANESLQSIAQEAARLQHLITRLRALYRNEVPRIVPLALRDVLADAHALVANRLAATGVEYVQQAADVRVLVDGERVVLAIANIVVNAMEAMAHGSGRRIEVHAAESGGCVRVAIRDTGPGLVSDQMTHLFEPFYTTKPSGQSLGLGLTLSARSLASIHGHLEAANHPDGGAVFTLSLPLAPASTDMPAGGPPSSGSLITA